VGGLAATGPRPSGRGRLEHGIAWFYPEPEREVAPIVDRICFLDERVDVEIDGEAQERPQSPFSPR